jgi:hypothetical protein
MCDTVGLHILSLKRVAMGPLLLGHLPEGKYRKLAPTEVEALKNIALRPQKQEEAPPRVKIRVPKSPKADNKEDKSNA